MIALIAAALQPPPMDSTQSAAIPADARAAIARANDDWLPAMRRQDATAIVEPYADDGVFVLATGECMKGRAAIEQLMRDRFTRTGRIVGGTLQQDGLVAA